MSGQCSIAAHPKGNTQGSLAHPQHQAQPHSVPARAQLRHRRWEEQGQRWSCMEGSQGSANYSALMRPFHWQEYSAEAEGGTGHLASFWVRGDRHRLNGNPGSCHWKDWGDKKAKMGPVWAEMTPAMAWHHGEPGMRQADVCKAKHAPVHLKSTLSPCTRGSQFLRTFTSPMNS